MSETNETELPDDPGRRLEQLVNLAEKGDLRALAGLCLALTLTPAVWSGHPELEARGDKIFRKLQGKKPRRKRRTRRVVKRNKVGD